MAPHVKSFVYTPLLIQHPNPIRLVRLHPTKLPHRIDCELIHVSLDTKPQYEALSYEWGPTSSNQFWVTIDGSQFRIRKNLWQALRCLRLDKEPRVLWIDALCINQGDTVERQDQVAKMGEIYSHAKRVVVWVGPEIEPLIGSNAEQADTLIALSFLANSSLDFKEHDRTWLALLKFCQRSYWTRLWIIQEVVLATEVIIQVGEMEMGWAILTQLLSELNSHTTEKTNVFEIGQSIRNSIPAKLNQQRLLRMDKEQEGSPVLDLIFLNENAMCSDNRDKIWGMHSLVKPCCRKALPIDYISSPVELCVKVLHHDLLCHRPKVFPFIRSAQRLLKILLNDQSSEYQWAASKKILLSMNPDTSFPSMDLCKEGTKDTDTEYVQLSGRVRGAIKWFGSQFLYTHSYHSWSGKYSNPYITDDKEKRVAQSGLVELLDQQEWSCPTPSEKIRAVVGGFDQPGTATPRCSSIPPSKSYASISASDRKPVIVDTKPVEDGGNGGVHKVLSRLNLKSRHLQLPVEMPKISSLSRRLSRSSDSLSSLSKRFSKPPVRANLPNEHDGDRILGLDNGLIAFAPKEAELGDLVCQLKWCDFFVIIRETDQSVNSDELKQSPTFKIVGTAGVIRKPDNVDLLEQEKVTLNLDIVTLLRLCWNFPYKKAS